jgi:hypothetical protein
MDKEANQGDGKKPNRGCIIAVGIFLVLGGAALFFLAQLFGVLGSVFLDATRLPEQKIVLQRVSDPNRPFDYLLTTDGSMMDRTWYAYRIEKAAAVPEDILVQDDGESALFWNYTESGNQAVDPNLEIAGKDYLVFWRGGIRHALYDLNSDETLVNYNISMVLQSYGDWPTPEYVADWKLKNIDSKIQGIIVGVDSQTNSAQQLIDSTDQD